MSSPDDWVVTVPSHARADTFTAKTLPLLLGGGIDLDRVTVFVAAPEVPAYEAALRPVTRAVRVRVGALGVGPNRNAILDAHPPGTRVVQIDDDMSSFIRRVDPKTAVPVTRLGDLITRGYEAADEEGLNLWGLYPVPNPYFMKDRVTTDLRYIAGALFGVTVTRQPHERVTLEDKEDFERSIRYYLHDSGVVRLENYSWITRCYREPGGMQTTRTEERVTASAHALVARYPELCKLNTRRKQHTEVTLRDTRLRRAVR